MTNLFQIITKLRTHPNNILAITWVGKDYSKLDLIRDLEALQAEDDQEQKEFDDEQRLPRG